VAEAQRLWGKTRFFFEEKKQKTFAPGGFGGLGAEPAGEDVFLLLFSQKKKFFLAGTTE
jgi:hypothetical protein